MRESESARPNGPAPGSVAVDKRLVAALVALIVILGIVFVLLWMLIPQADDTPEADVAKTGLESVLIITGPAKGDLPALKRPLSAAWGPDGRIYVSDTGNARICVFNDRGRFIREFGRTSDGAAEDDATTTLMQPAGIAVAEDGTVYVADLRRDAVLVYDAEGDFADSFQAEAGWKPVDVAVSGDRLAVAGANGITVMSRDGERVSTLNAGDSVAAFNRPNGVAFLSATQLVVSDTNNARIVAIGLDGTMRWEVSSGMASIGLPRGIAVGSDGSVVFADAFRFAIARIAADAAPQGMYGARGNAPAHFEFPNDVDMRDDLALVADKDNNRVQVVRLVGWPDSGGIVAPEK